MVSTLCAAFATLAPPFTSAHRALLVWLNASTGTAALETSLWPQVEFEQIDHMINMRDLYPFS